MSVWDEIVGHPEAVATLREAVDGGRVTHAWLFTGPPGVGKVYVARVFAAALNCPDGGDGSCEVCRRVSAACIPTCISWSPRATTCWWTTSGRCARRLRAPAMRAAWPCSSSTRPTA